MLAIVLVVHDGVGRGQPRAQPVAGRLSLGAAAIGEAGPGEEGLAEIGAAVPDLLVDHRLHAGAIGARLGAEDAGEILPCPMRRRDRVGVGRFLARGDGADGGIDQVDLFREGVAEHAGNPQRDIDARTFQLGEREHAKAGDAAGAGFPDRLGADQRQHLRDVVAAGAHVGRAPGGNRHRTRPLALVLHVAQHERLGRQLADPPCGGGRHGAGVDRIEVPAGRQHVRPAARWRAGGAGRHETAIERGKHGRDLLAAAAIQ